MTEDATMANGQTILQELRRHLDINDYRKLHWEGTFQEYLDIVMQDPKITRTAYQRIYDMIISHGTEEVYENKEKVTRYRFFTDYASKFDDGIYGLERPLMQLVNQFKSAAKGYGTERRVLLLHGPVGSSKSTIVRLLKRGLERYSETEQGALYTFSWKNAREGEPDWVDCPMHEDPLRLIPSEIRKEVIRDLLAGVKT